MHFFGRCLATQKNPLNDVGIKYKMLDAPVKTIAVVRAVVELS
jgi:hypothetical protein